jgi:pSer/pThr/pTyr-binding forkhead associated (FHA) protein
MDTLCTHLLGRDSDSAVPLGSPGVSRRHAEVIVSADGAKIRDLGSRRNGTRLGGERIETQVQLSDGDEIGIGSFRLVFRMTTDSATTEPL